MSTPVQQAAIQDQSGDGGGCGYVVARCNEVSLLDDNQSSLQMKCTLWVPASHFEVQPRVRSNLEQTSQLRIHPVCAGSTIDKPSISVPDTALQDVHAGSSPSADGDSPLATSPIMSSNWSPAATGDLDLVETLCASLTTEDLVQLEQTQSNYSHPDCQTVVTRSNHPARMQSISPLVDSLSDIHDILRTTATSGSAQEFEGMQLLTTDQGSTGYSEDPTDSSVPPPVTVDCSILNELIATPFLNVVTQPPNTCRLRYEREAQQNPKGLLRNEDGESVVIKLENVKDGVENIIVIIGAVTRCGAPHPTVYPTCFGRQMPADWTENTENKTVMTVLSASENYTKWLKFLGLKRRRLDSVDRKQFQMRELTYFRLKFTVEVASPVGSFTTITTETHDVHAVCPSTWTKLKREQSQGMQTRYYAQQQRTNGTQPM